MIIYKHTNNINGKCYVGQTTYKNPNDRWRNGKGYGTQTKFYNAIKKYGWDNFTHEILCECSEEEADELERYYIALFNCIDHGYNSTTGGNLKKHVCRESVEKRIQKVKGRHLSPKSEFKKGNVPWNTGLKMSDEYKLKLSKVHFEKDRARWKPVVATDLVTNETYEYECIAICARELNCDASTIRKVCKGILHTHHGYTFRYKAGDELYGI